MNPQSATPKNDIDNKHRVFAIIGASSGNLVEWFDFYVYSFCAIYFAPAFFPSGNSTTQLLNTAGVCRRISDAPDWWLVIWPHRR